MKEHELKFNDLREYLKLTEQLGAFKQVDGASWDLEVGALTEAAAERFGPALLFDNIPDYPKGFRIATNTGLSYLQTALQLRLPLEGNGDMPRGLELLQQWREKLRTYKPVPPVEVKEGPIMENVDQGNDVNLWKFPAPRWHEKDGGRYLGTGCVNITSDPDNGDVNMGVYRCMIHTENTIGVKANKGKHGRIHLDKYHSAGKPCPMLICIGHDPTLFLSGVMTVAYGVSELSWGGWLRGEPIPYVKAPLTGLPMPATAEIVLEGEIPVDSNLQSPQEGPFGEWPGYYADTTSKEVPVMHVKAIYYRNDPIILGVPPLRFPSPYFLGIPPGAAMAWDQLDAAGVPDVTGVWGFCCGSQTGLFTVIRIRQRYAGHPKQALLVTAGCRAGSYGGKFYVVVDDDVDITNPREVLWAIATRTNIANDIDTVKEVWTSPADPAITLDMRETQSYTSDRLFIDACRPWRWRDDFPEPNDFPREFKEKILKKWPLE